MRLQLIGVEMDADGMVPQALETARTTQGTATRGMERSRRATRTTPMHTTLFHDAPKRRRAKSDRGKLKMPSIFYLSFRVPDLQAAADTHESYQRFQAEAG
jgi:hypothetical protein